MSIEVMSLHNNQVRFQTDTSYINDLNMLNPEKPLYGLITGNELFTRILNAEYGSINNMIHNHCHNVLSTPIL